MTALRPLPVAGGVRPANAQSLAPLASFIDLEQDFRRAPDLSALRIAFVTGARRLVAYDCALLLECGPATPDRTGAFAPPTFAVMAAAGASSIDREAPLVRAVEQLVNTLAAEAPDEASRPQMLDVLRHAAGSAIAREAAGFPHLFWLPLIGRDGTRIGGLAAFHRTPWSPERRQLLGALAEPFIHARAAFADQDFGLVPGLRRFRAQGKLRLVLPALAAMILLFPVRFSVLAPAEIVGSLPTLIAAPLDGILRDIAVSPGDAVKPGEKLLSFTDTKLRNDVDIAARAVAVAAARYQRVLQSAVANQRDGQEIAVARADLAVAEAELALAEDLLGRAEVKAPRAGIAVFSAKADWVGKPVSTGERIMDIVDPADVEVRVELGMGDALSVEPGKPVRLFLDGSPLSSLTAIVDRIGYRPMTGPDLQMSYRLHARFAEDSPAPRLGARGTARIDGGLVPLGYYLFRRPLAALRQKLGI